MDITADAPILIIIKGRIYQPIYKITMTTRIIELYLTDMTLHAKHFQSASTLEKAAKKRTSEGLPHGRLYGPTPTVSTDGRYQAIIKLPEELQTQVDSGEVEIRLMMPKEGLSVYADKGVSEKIVQQQKKHTRMAIHRSRVWRDK